jgi:hypothetical protein
MLHLNQIRLFSGDHDDGYPISEDDFDNAKIAFAIIVAVFALQFVFGGLAVLRYWLES